MARPVLFTIAAFDKANIQDFMFSWSGSQSVKNKLTIRHNATNDIVYAQEQITMQLRHRLPSDTLINGVLYNAQIIVYDVNNVASAASESMLFYCYTAPILSFVNLAEGQKINNSSHEVQMSYLQLENELLNSYQVKLYSSGQSVLHQSGILYNLSEMKYTISGLENNKSYYVECIGKTINDTVVTTGKILVNVEYIQPTAYTFLEVVNLPKEGLVRLHPNIVSLVGISNPDPPVFINNSRVDLRADDAWVKFADNFTIDNDFTLQLQGSDFVYDRPLIICENAQTSLVVTLRKAKFNSYISEKMYAELIVHGVHEDYCVMSNFLDRFQDMYGIDVSTQPLLQIWMRRINNYYEIKIERSMKPISVADFDLLQITAGELYALDILVSDFDNNASIIFKS